MAPPPGRRRRQRLPARRINGASPRVHLNDRLPPRLSTARVTGYARCRRLRGPTTRSQRVTHRVGAPESCNLFGCHGNRCHHQPEQPQEPQPPRIGRSGSSASLAISAKSGRPHRSSRSSRCSAISCASARGTGSPMAATARSTGCSVWGWKFSRRTSSSASRSRLPMTLPTKGGTIDFVAEQRRHRRRRRGDPRRRLRRRSVEDGTRDRGHRGRPLMVIDGIQATPDGDVAFRTYGFASAAGGVGQRFYSKYYEAHDPNPRTIVNVLANTVMSLPLRAATPRHRPRRPARQVRARSLRADARCASRSTA